MDGFATALGFAGDNSLTGFLAAAGIWLFGVAMIRSNKARAVQAAEDRKARAEQAAEDRKARAEQAAQAAQTVAQTVAQAMAHVAAQAAEDRKAQAAQAAEDGKVTQGLLKALESQGAAIQKLINRTDGVVVELEKRRPPEKPG